MPFFQDLFEALLRNYTSRRNIILLFRFFIIFISFVVLFSLLFHMMMVYEGRSYSWPTGLYWTLTVMTTLGFGDITFTSDLGRLFTMGVLCSGFLLLLVLMPLLFMQGQTVARVPVELPKDARGHVIVCLYDAVIAALITRLVQYHQPYVLLIPDVDEALRLYDLGLNVVVGELDQAETFERLQAAQAALVVMTATDATNTNVVFTLREVAANVPVIATATHAMAGHMLGLAGCSHVLYLGRMLGAALARRIDIGGGMPHVIGRFERLLIAEAAAAHTPLAGTTLTDNRLRECADLSVIGVWERGRFEIAGSETAISPETVLVLAGTPEQLRQYNAWIGAADTTSAPVIILGGGRVGLAIASVLAKRNIAHCIVEQRPELMQASSPYIIGNAEEEEVLRTAGIMEAPAVVTTTHDDDLNVYLTLLCRHLRPDMQIISRAALERNVATLHRAGADFVMSYASLGANTIWNYLMHNDVLMVTEGLNVFQVPLPAHLAGKTIEEAISQSTAGCHVVAVEAEGHMQINPEPSLPLPSQAEVILIGTAKAE
ncbi:potassium channel family protein [Candidatus Entotheonella palauensis]|uniref:potassium channel family protein n=1 Tax=Candidatus Entotheonella palauensis TaxID=93172 RepID=UPI000B800C1C|nr:NAD-binding protein [Candidatus Entotheonella palauensis]